MDLFVERGFDPSAIQLPPPGTSLEAGHFDSLQFEQVVSFDLFPEGPSYRPTDGSIFFAGNNALSRITPDGELHTLLEKPSGGGTHLLPDSSILIIGHMGLRRVRPDGSIALLADGEKIGKGNDITIGIHKEVYFSVPRKAIYRVTPGPNGKLEKVSDKGANGLDVDPEGKYLYVHRMGIRRYEITGPDSPLGEEELVYLPPKEKRSLDGCTFDARGNLYSMIFRTGTILVTDPVAKRPIAEIPCGVAPAANLTFGGPGNDELIVLAGTPKHKNCQVLRGKVGVTGFPGHVGATDYPEIRLLDESLSPGSLSGD